MHLIPAMFDFESSVKDPNPTPNKLETIFADTPLFSVATALRANGVGFPEGIDCAQLGVLALIEGAVEVLISVGLYQRCHEAIM